MNKHQLDMFSTHEEPAPSGPVVYRADPDKVRLKLERILAEARAAKTMPWDRAKQGYYRTVFPQMTRWLPEDEATALCEEFSQQIERLGRVA
ncbi:hypothetical protein [Oricola cellulosilytica]|uniref:Uncharacterized protein n=1 Tax=Oricola cellulosilytica TaxID=1429082 RepID=A0A4V2MNU0_9HYPH|nr:hypothetical protein [Oricola cellulosilytica]TCD14517.1 hypothetical protein E0D97_10705 [Oricola cellulosilytica]